MGLMETKHNRSTDTGVVAVIPAKLTSVRLPRKNIADMGGYPMFYYSVRAAQMCPDIDTVYVSSEAPEIRKLAVDYGAETISRPEELSAPHVTNLSVLRHALEEITRRRGTPPELMVLLQPTHPLRQPQSIKKGIKRMRQDQGADTLLTVVRTDELRGEIQDGRFVPEFPMPRDKSLEPKLYRNTGSFYIFRVARTLANGRMFTESILPLTLDRPEFEVDVDEASDLAIARCILETNQDEFPGFLSDGEIK